MWLGSKPSAFCALTRTLETTPLVPQVAVKSLPACVEPSWTLRQRTVADVGQDAQTPTGKLALVVVQFFAF